MSQVSVTIPINKIDTEKRLVTGWAALSEDKDGKPIVDLQGDIIPIEELESAVQEAFVYGGSGKGGDMHERTGVADVVEALVVTKGKREALGFGEGPTGWVVTLKIKDDALWNEIKSGKKLELSLAGEAIREEVA